MNNRDGYYKWTNDNKILAMISLVISSLFLVFGFIRVPVVTYIHAYTIGLLLGYYSPLFYGYIIVVSLYVMIPGAFKKIEKYKIDLKAYLVISFTIVWLGTNTYYYQYHEGWTTIGSKSFDSFKRWEEVFTRGPWWAPENTNGGILGASIYGYVSMLVSGIGTAILSLPLLLISISLFATNTWVGLYFKSFSNVKKKVKNKQKNKPAYVNKFERKEKKSKSVDKHVEHPVTEKQKPVIEKKNTQELILDKEIEIFEVKKEPEEKEIKKTKKQKIEDAEDMLLDKAFEINVAKKKEVELDKPKIDKPKKIKVKKKEEKPKNDLPFDDPF